MDDEIMNKIHELFKLLWLKESKDGIEYPFVVRTRGQMLTGGYKLTIEKFNGKVDYREEDQNG